MRLMKKYTTLLFDNDNTLMDFYAAEEQAIKNTCRVYGVEPSDENARLYSKINDGFWKRFEKGEIKREEIKVGRFKGFIEALGLDINAEKMAATYFEELANGNMLLDGAEELCRALSGEYTLHLITNGSTYIQKKRLAASPISKYFSKIFISEEMGVKKPDRAFFDTVISQIDEKDRSRICIIGDSMSSDILGGINAGIDTCFFNRSREEKKYEPTYEVKSFEEIKKLFTEDLQDFGFMV